MQCFKGKENNEGQAISNTLFNCIIVRKYDIKLKIRSKFISSPIKRYIVFKNEFAKKIRRLAILQAFPYLDYPYIYTLFWQEQLGIIYSNL